MDKFRENLLRLMEAKGYSRRRLSLSTGRNETLLRDILDKNKTPEYATLRALARELGCTVEELTGEEPLPSIVGQAVIPDNITSVVRYDAALSAGPGSLIDPNAEPLGICHFETQWLRSVTRAASDNLAVVRVAGDSMFPTLSDGDWILIDRTQRRPAQEGVYAIRVHDSVWIKRLSINLKDRLIQIISDNTFYPVQEVDAEDLDIIGKAVWIVARKI